MKISVIMASYNYAQYIGDAIESVINQTYSNWELIIIDDGSKDNSLEIINQYLEKDSRIKLYTHAENKNKGLAQSLQLGINKSIGEWITFLESDDLFTENALAEKISVIENNPNIDLIFSDVEMFQDKELIEYYNEHYFTKRNTFADKEDIFTSSKIIKNPKKILLNFNIIPTFSILTVRKNVIQKCNFNTVFANRLDYYILAQLSEKKMYYIHKKLTLWRMHRNSYTNLCKKSYLKEYIFSIQIYYFLIKDKNPLIKCLLLLHYMRLRLIYIKLNRNTIKINIFNNKFIFEKKLS